MIKEIRLPEVSENVESGEISRVLVSVGDVIDVDQSIIELETDKAVVEVPSPYKGRVTELLVEPGQTIKIDSVILKLEESNESDKQVVEEEHDEEDGEIQKETEAPKESKSAPAEAVKPAHPTPPKPRRDLSIDPQMAIIPASPSVRRMAREIGVDLTEVEGTGPGERIQVDDVKRHAKQLLQSTQTAAISAPADRPLPDFSRWGEIDPQPMSKIRRVTAYGLSYAWSTVPHVTQFDKADITELEQFRRRYSGQVEAAGGKLTVTAILARILPFALKAFPQFNASIDVADSRIIFKKYYNIGIAVDTDRGLLVPVIKNADQKTLTEICVEAGELAEKARSKSISADEMEGGNFTISNLGSIGGTNFTPIVYSPQAAILGVDRAGIEPVFKDGQFVPRTMLPLALSYDHRIIDGADAARFTRWIVDTLQNPLKILL